MPLVVEDEDLPHYQKKKQKDEDLPKKTN